MPGGVSLLIICMSARRLRVKRAKQRAPFPHIPPRCRRHCSSASGNPPVSWGLNDEKTIRADAAMSVAEPCHVGGVQHQPSVSVVEHDEVVPGAIHLAKGELHTQD